MGHHNQENMNIHTSVRTSDTTRELRSVRNALIIFNISEYEPGWAAELVWLLWKRDQSLTSGNQTMFPPSYSPLPCHYSDYVISAPTILHVQNKNNDTLIMNFDMPAIT